MNGEPTNEYTSESIGMKIKKGKKGPNPNPEILIPNSHQSVDIRNSSSFQQKKGLNPIKSSINQSGFSVPPIAQSTLINYNIMNNNMLNRKFEVKRQYQYTQDQNGGFLNGGV